MRTYTVITVNPLEKCAKDDKPAGTLYQYDYGQRLVFGGVELPDAYEVHFSNQRMGNSVTVIGDVTGVDIPDELLLTGQDVHVWLYLHQGETDGETVYYARIAVKTRAKPTHETPTPVQQDEITQVIAALGSAVDHVDDIAEAMPGEIRDALQEAKDSGEFDGPPGPQGEKGDKGDAGADGISPAASVSKSGGVATVTITDADGTTTAEIYDGAAGKDGKDGKDGADGADGFSPSASVSKSGSTATITITDRTGTTTASVQDGADGADGQDGYTPVRGTDYWTAADQAQILEDVEDALIDDTAAAGDVTKVWSADKSSSEVTALKSAIDSKAPVISRTASGDIVNISDGADGIPLSSCVVSIDPVQAAGTPTPEIPLPISGRTGAQIIRTGMNLLAGDMFNHSGGKTVYLGMNDSTSFPYFLKAGTYTLWIEAQNVGTTMSLYLREAEDSGNTRIDTSTSNLYATFTTEKDGYYRFWAYNSTALTSADIKRYQLALGSEITAYQPYQGQTYAVDWQTAAGTVYGGYVDPVKGELTVDRVYAVLDDPTKWEAFESGTTIDFLYNHDFSNRKHYSTSYAGLVCTMFRASATGTEAYIRWNGASTDKIGIKNVSTAYTLQDVQGFSSSGQLAILYDLAEPQVYQLDPVSIQTLLGENRLWSNTGAIAVTYPADTQTYVDSAITAATDPDGNVVQVTGTTPSITGESGKRYVCGTVDSISITPPQTGIIDVVFTSGTTPTVLTVPGTVKFPAWFDATALDASTTYEINVQDGVYGAVSAWT